MLTSIVAWKWKPPGAYRSTFGPATVNTLFRMVKRHYSAPFRSICVTDDPAGLDPHIEVVPIWTEWADIPSPHGSHNPSCYRRLKAFAPEARDLFGERFAWIDLDTVITGDLRLILDRPEEFVCWGETDPRSYYNGSLVLMTAGARKQVYERFNPKTSPHEAKAAGKFGSDQGWLSYVLGPGEATWTTKDGVYSYRIHLHPKQGALPKDARMVMWHGGQDPWGAHGQKLEWVRRHYQ